MTTVQVVLRWVGLVSLAGIFLCGLGALYVIGSCRRHAKLWPEHARGFDEIRKKSEWTFIQAVLFGTLFSLFAVAEWVAR